MSFFLMNSPLPSELPGTSFSEVTDASKPLLRLLQDSIFDQYVIVENENSGTAWWVIFLIVLLSLLCLVLLVLLAWCIWKKYNERQQKSQEVGPKKQIYVYRSQSQKERWEKIKKEEEKRRMSEEKTDSDKEESLRAYEERKARRLSMSPGYTPSTASANSYPVGDEQV